MGPRDAGDTVPEIQHEGFDVERDHRFVLDDQDIRRHLLGDFAACRAQ